MLVDANILLYAAHRESRLHTVAAAWLTEQLNGSRRVGLPWQTLGAFLRISTNPRAYERPLSPDRAWAQVKEWLAAETAWMPQPAHRYGDVLGALIRDHELRGDLVTDAQLAALAIEHGLTVYSTDTDFARFTEISWENPLQPPKPKTRRRKR